jgi:hypothetical protein
MEKEKKRNGKDRESEVFIFVRQVPVPRCRVPPLCSAKDFAEMFRGTSHSDCRGLRGSTGPYSECHYRNTGDCKRTLCSLSMLVARSP